MHARMASVCLVCLLRLLYICVYIYILELQGDGAARLLKAMMLDCMLCALSSNPILLGYAGLLHPYKLIMGNVLDLF